jgi:hypothetical protein
MSDTKHTAEPWIVCEKLSGSENHQGFTIRSRGGWAIAVVNPLDQHGTGGKANADRIVACVNACRGMADPAAEITRLRTANEELLGACRKFVDAYRRITPETANLMMPEDGERLAEAISAAVPAMLNAEQGGKGESK